MYPVDSGKNGLGASSPDVRLQERRTPLEALDGEDINSCLCEWPWPTRKTPWVCASVLWNGFGKLKRCPGVTSLARCISALFCSHHKTRFWVCIPVQQDLVKERERERIKFFWNGFIKSRIICETCQWWEKKKLKPSSVLLAMCIPHLLHFHWPAKVVLKGAAQ